MPSPALPFPCPSLAPAPPHASPLPRCAAYTLNTFPIVRRRDQAACGTYRTKDMVLAYYNALAAGDADVEVTV